MKWLILLLIALSFLLSCDLSSPNDINDSEITNLLDDIKIAFSMYDITEIMDQYSDDYLHNGNDYDDEYQIWDSRLINFTSIQFSDIEIEYIGDNYAEIYFTLKLSGDDGSFTWDEPSVENGDISYLKLINGNWRIFGNRLD